MEDNYFEMYFGSEILNIQNIPPKIPTLTQFNNNTQFESPLNYEEKIQKKTQNPLEQFQQEEVCYETPQDDNLIPSQQSNSIQNSNKQQEESDSKGKQITYLKLNDQQQSSISSYNSTSEASSSQQETKTRKTKYKKIEGQLPFTDSKASINVTRNYINGIICYIQENEEQILKWLQKSGIQLANPSKFFKDQLNKRKNILYSMKHFKRLISLKSIQGKIIRVFGYKYFREEAFQYFYSNNYKHKGNQLRFRHVIDQAFRDPCNFVQLKY